MGFVLEHKHEWSDVDQAKVRQLVASVKEDRRPSAWVVDRERGIVLIAFSAGRQSNDPNEATAGRYVLFESDYPIIIDAYLEGFGAEKTYRISAVSLPNNLEMDRSQVFQHIKEAFSVEGTRYSNKFKSITTVRVEFSGVAP